MDILKETIKDVEATLYQIAKLENVQQHWDYKILSYDDNKQFKLKGNQKERMNKLLNQFLKEMRADIEPTQRKLATLEELLG